MLLSWAYGDNHFSNILSQCKGIRTPGAFCFASKDEGVQEIIRFLNFTQRQCIYAYSCQIQLLHRLLEGMPSSSDSDRVMVLGVDKC